MLPSWFKTDLSERLEIKPEEVEDWVKSHSPEVIFEEWCDWNGFIGWSGRIKAAAIIADTLGRATR